MGTDKNCQVDCNLEMGISERFDGKLKEQESVRSSKANVNVATFEDTKKQAKFKSILQDPLVKALDHPEDQQIFRAGLEGMERNHPEILKGEQTNLVMCPTAFNYDSRVDGESSVPEVLEKWQEELEATQNLSPQQKTNLHTIRNHLGKIKPQIAEQEFFDAFTTFFYNKRGIFIHSLKMDSYLKVFIDKAQRERNENTGTRLSPLEKRLAEALNIPKEDLTMVSDTVMNHLRQMPYFNATKPINGRKIRDAIDETLQGDLVQKAKSKFKEGQDYNQSQILRALRLAKFESICKFSGENDMFILLPDQKLILCIEVKQHMKKHDEATTHNRIDGNLKSAAAQLKKNADHTAQMHGSILSPGWRFVKIAALSPKVYNSQKICPSCNPFIITTDMIKQPGGMLKWWKGTGLDRIPELDARTKREAYKEFLIFYNRMVNLSKVRVMPDTFKTWEQIQGQNPHHMAAGYTAASAPSAPLSGDVEDLLQRPHDAFKVIALNDDQEALLFEDIQLVVFFNDFGAGKFKHFI